MSGLADKKRWLAVAGISKLWYLPMSKVTLKPSGVEIDIGTSEIATSSSLYILNIESSGANYYQKPVLDKVGLRYDLSIEAENIVLDADKDNELNKLMREPLLIFFKDNHNRFRFIVNARLLSEENTGSFIGGKPHYSILIKASAGIGAYYCTKTISIDSSGFLILS